jgi:hypothetical protein
LTLILVLFLSSGTAYAQAYLSLGVSTVYDNVYVDSYLDDVVGPLSDSVSQGTLTGPSLLEATGDVDYGVFHGYALSVLDIPSPPHAEQYGYAVVYGDWSDEVIPAGPVGTFGTWVVAFLASGTGLAEDASFLGDLAGAGWDINLGTPWGGQNFGGAWDQSGYRNGDPLGTVLLASLPVVLGEPQSLSVHVQVAAQTGSGIFSEAQTILAEVDFSTTVQWLGTVAVLDENENPIPISITSASGTDWTQPVPEPGTASMLLVGSATIVWMTRRRGVRE